MNTNLTILSAIYIVIVLFFFDWFGMDNLELPKNNFNRRNTKNGYFAFTLYLVPTIGIAYLISYSKLQDNYPNLILLVFFLGYILSSISSLSN